MVRLHRMDPFVPSEPSWYARGGKDEEEVQEKLRMARLRGEPALKGAVQNAMLKGEDDVVQKLMVHSVRKASEFRRRIILGGQREVSAFERVVDAAASWLGEAVAGSAKAASAQAESKGLDVPEMGPSLTTPGDNGTSTAAAVAQRAEEMARTAEEAMEAALAIAGQEGEAATRVEARAALNAHESARGYAQLVESLRAMSGLDGGGQLLHAVHPGASPVLATVGPAGDTFANIAVNDARTLAAGMKEKRPVGYDFLGTAKAEGQGDLTRTEKRLDKVPNPHRLKELDASSLHAIDLSAYRKPGWVSSQGFDEDVDEVPLFEAMPDLDRGMQLPDGLGPRRGRETVPSARTEVAEISRGLGARPAGVSEGRDGVVSAQMGRHWWMSGGAVGGPMGTQQELEALARAQKKADAALREEERLEMAGDGGEAARGAAIATGLMPSPESAADFVKVQEAKREVVRERLGKIAQKHGESPSAASMAEGIKEAAEVIRQGGNDVDATADYASVAKVAADAAAAESAARGRAEDAAAHLSAAAVARATEDWVRARAMAAVTEAMSKSRHLPHLLKHLGIHPRAVAQAVVRRVLPGDRADGSALADERGGNTSKLPTQNVGDSAVLDSSHVSAAVRRVLDGDSTAVPELRAEVSAAAEQSASTAAAARAKASSKLSPERVEMLSPWKRPLGWTTRFGVPIQRAATPSDVQRALNISIRSVVESYEEWIVGAQEAAEVARKAVLESEQGSSPSAKAKQAQEAADSAWDEYLSRMEREALEESTSNLRGNRPDLSNGLHAPELPSSVAKAASDSLSMGGPDVDALDRFEEQQLQHTLDQMGVPRGSARRQALLEAGRLLLPETTEELTGSLL